MLKILLLEHIARAAAAIAATNATGGICALERPCRHLRFLMKPQRSATYSPSMATKYPHDGNGE